MPWRECCKMEERLRFVARLLEGEKMAVLCREFDISRKTGYKIFTRYKNCGCLFTTMKQLAIVKECASSRSRQHPCNIQRCAPATAHACMRRV
jgi:hypothetical protein